MRDGNGPKGMRGKEKVIIVGNSPSILNRNYGKLIDSYDVVIRLNRCVTEGFEDNIGSKIDVWATTRTDGYDELFVPTNYKDIKHLWVRSKRIIPNKRYSYDKKTRLPLPDDFPVVGRHIMFDNFWHTKYMVWLKSFRLKEQLCTGLLTILTACKFYDDITVHGFTFGDMRKNEDRLSGYYRKAELKEGIHLEDKLWNTKWNLHWGRDSELKKRRKVLNYLIKRGIKENEIPGMKKVNRIKALK